MRIVIDLQGTQTESRFRGIGRYSLSLAKAMVRNRGEHEVIIALSDLFPDTIEPIRAEFIDLLSQDNIRVWEAPGPVRESEPGNTWRREAAELIREAFLASLQPDIVYITSLFEGYVDDAVTSIGRFDQTTPVCASLYDLIPLLNPDQYLKPNPAYEEYYLRKVEHLMRSSLLFAISEYSQQEGIKHLEQYDGSIVNISTAADDHFQPLSLSPPQAQGIQDKFGLTRSFVLYSGGADDRKNLPRLIRAYSRLSDELRDNHQLVLAGKMPDGNILQLQEEARTAGLRSDELVFTGYISEDDLVNLYNICKLYVFPSWHEGFGLPALEAMSCGAPVIGSNASSIPEVIGNKNALFDPYSEDAITEKMKTVLQDEQLLKNLQEHGLKQARKFSWDKTARHAISAIEETVNTSQHVSYEETDIQTSRLISTIASIKNVSFSDQDLIMTASVIAKNSFNPGYKQLLIDISELVQRDARTGIQRVVRSLLNVLLTHPPEGLRVEPVYATTEQGYRYARRFAQTILGNSADTVVDEPVDYQSGDYFIGLDLQSHVVLAQRAFYQELRRHGVQVQFVVYDLLCILMPHNFGEGAAEGHRRWLEVVAESDGAICISKAVADELEIWCRDHGPERLRPFAISWFHLGADVESSMPSKGIPDDASMVLKAIRKKPSFLMVGTIEPRKGHAQTLAAFEQLWAKGVDVNLIIVGKQGWKVDELIDKLRQHPKSGRRLFLLEGISDEYLEKVYIASTCLIAASEGEGFGLPLIEAAQHKIPIIARDIPVFREVAEQYAFYFNGTDPSALAIAIQDWLKLYQTDQHPQSDSMPWLTWEQSAKSLLSNLTK